MQKKHNVFAHKDSANRIQYKINSFIFIVEMQPIFDFSKIVQIEYNTK